VLHDTSISVTSGRGDISSDDLNIHQVHKQTFDSIIKDDFLTDVRASCVVLNQRWLSFDSVSRDIRIALSLAPAFSDIARGASKKTRRSDR
jgi:hypothetical protein